MKNIILASKSPRRKDLLKQIGINPVIMPTQYQEKDILLPKSQVLANAEGKAEWLAKRTNENSIIIAADTIVTINGIIIGKPQDKEEAYAMLKMLSGKSHLVLSAICVIDTESNVERSEVIETEVVIRDIYESELLNYIETNEPYDKAGGYAIQGKAGIFVKKIFGSYSNVVGLPLTELVTILREFGIEVTSRW